VGPGVAVRLGCEADDDEEGQGKSNFPLYTLHIPNSVGKTILWEILGNAEINRVGTY
jgi:hypothetical protein